MVDSFVFSYAFYLKAILIFLTSLAFVACDNHQSSQPRALVPWSTGNGSYELQEIPFLYLRDPKQLKSKVVEIYIGDRESSSQVAQPRWSRQGDLFIAMDAESVVAASAYLIYERLYQFEENLGVSQYISWPRKVRVEMSLSGRDGQRLSDGAFYIPSVDETWLASTSNATLPLAANIGVVAHEHFHAYFTKIILKRIPPLENNIDGLISTINFQQDISSTVEPDGVVASNLKEAKLKQRLMVNQTIIYAWNEGLADYWGYLVSREPDFISFSFSPLHFREDRGLHIPEMPFLWSHAQIVQNLKQYAIRKTDCSPQCLYYRMGTSVARLLYRLVHQGGLRTKTGEVIDHDKMGHLIIEKLYWNSNEIVNAYNQRELHVMDLLDWLLRDIQLNESGCQVLSEVLDKEIMTKEYKHLECQ